MHKILCLQNRFGCKSMHLGNHAHKRVDMHVTNSNNNIIQWQESRNCTKLELKLLVAKNGLSISVLCINPFLQIIIFILVSSVPC